MAEAKITTKPVVAPIESLTLTLTVDEAKTLKTILRHIAGDDKYSPRKHATSISIAIHRAEVAAGTELDNYKESNCVGKDVPTFFSKYQGIYFSDY